MERVVTTKMTSKGQVVIPESIRKLLGLQPGMKFVVFYRDDVVVLKPISRPVMTEFDQLIHEAHEMARRARIRAQLNAGLAAARKRG